MSKLPAGFFNRIIYILQNYGISMLRGAGVTLLIALVGTAIGCVIGFLCGVAQTIPEQRGKPARNALVKLLKAVISVYVEVFRGTPMMVQAMFIYYGAMIVFGYHMPMMAAAFFIVSINTGAYMAETVRGGILSVDPGQKEGAMAIGMTHVQLMNCVLLPQALRNIMPQIGNNLIINIKDTCVLSCISVVELFFTSQSVAGTYYIYFEVFTITMVMYLIMTVSFSKLLRSVERRLAGSANYDLATTDTLAHTTGTYSYPGKEFGSGNLDLNDIERRDK